jgi:hypothetical protein
MDADNYIDAMFSRRADGKVVLPREFRFRDGTKPALKEYHLIRQFHRWISIIFMAIVIAIFIALGEGKELAEWVYFLPLFPLALLLLTGCTYSCCPMPSGGATGKAPPEA